MEETKITKKGFFKKVWYSVFDLDKYGEMAAEGVPRAIFYTIKLALVISIIIAIGSIIHVNGLIKKGVDFLDTQVGEFTYKDGVLNVDKEEPIRAPSQNFGEIIIDTKAETEEQIDEYIKSLKTDRAIIILKDKVIARGLTRQGDLQYHYEDILKGANITEFNKEQIKDIVNGENTWKLLLAVVLVIVIYMLINYVLQFLWNAVMLGIFGYIVAFFTKIKIRYAAIFNMACYAFTLSVLLQVIYTCVNIFVVFNIKYFQVMYVAIAAIYLIAAIFLIRAELIKQQMEVEKVMKVGKQKENEDEEQQENNDEKKEDKNTGDKEDKKENKKDNGEQPEGSEA